MLPIPNKLQAKGISIREPPGTPAVPQAHTDANKDKSTAVIKCTSMPNVWHADSVSTVIVTAAPAILMVEPNGIDTPNVSSGRFSLRHRFMFTGMLAAEERVKNAITPDSLRTVNVSG